MSSITFETASDENQLTVKEFVRYACIRDLVEKFLENVKMKEALAEYEEKLSGLSIDLTIKYTIEKKY